MAIYCMSGTGNSYYAAKQLAKTFNIELVNLVQLKGTHLDPKADLDDLVGFVFPIYDFDAPKIVYQQIEKIQARSEAYRFAVGTYGVGTLGAYKKILPKFKEKRIPLEVAFGLEMPHNAVGSVNLSVEEISKKIAAGESGLLKIVQGIENRVRGDYMTTRLSTLLVDGTFFKMLPSVLPLMKALIIDGSESLRFVADDTCSHCGRCERICPNHNIQLIEGKPVFGDDCLSCFGCIQWCSESAISFGGKRLGLGHYTHPQVSAEEMIAFQTVGSK